MARDLTKGFPAAVLAVLAITGGLAAGVGGYTFVYAEGASYLTDEAAACANCHIMREQYAGWVKSSHRSVATCNDCHTPDRLVGKYLSKATNGFWHSFAFTSGRFAEPIRIKPGNREIANSACHRCHGDFVAAGETDRSDDTRLDCIRCHDSVGH